MATQFEQITKLAAKHKRTKTPKRQGMVVWRGKAEYDNATDIVLIATPPGTNRKLGPKMWTLWIMLEHIHPMDAVKSGADYAVCGNCPLRPSIAEKLKAMGIDASKCYVNVGREVGRIWECFKRGGYQETTPADFAVIIRNFSARIGGHGDGGAVPVHIIKQILGYDPLTGQCDIETYTNYSHGWTTPGWNPEHLDIAMVSLDRQSIADYPGEFAALPANARTYRVLGSDEPIPGKRASEVLCPNYSKAVQCGDCGLCAGSLQAKSIVAPDHGPGSAYRNAQVAAAKAAKKAA